MSYNLLTYSPSEKSVSVDLYVMTELKCNQQFLIIDIKSFIDNIWVARLWKLSFTGYTGQLHL